MSHQWSLWVHVFLHLHGESSKKPQFSVKAGRRFCFLREVSTAWLFKLTPDHCTMTFLLHSHQRPVRALGAAAERKNDINMNKPHRACQAEQPHLLS